MKRRNTTPKFIARKTVLFTVIGCVVLGLASLLVGLQMHRDSLLEASMRVNRMTAARAAVVAQKAADTVGLAGDVMGVYRNLTPEQRSRTGTEEYRQHFRALESAGSPGGTSAVLTYKLRNYAQDVSALYLCALDREGNALVCLADTDEENPMYPGDWFEIPAEWTEQIAKEKKGDWSGGSTLVFYLDVQGEDRMCIAVFPVADESNEDEDDPSRNIAFVISELSVNSVLEEGNQYVLKVSIVMLILTVLIAFAMGVRMKRTVADPVNTIANAARNYVQDRKNGVARSDHFSALGIRTGDELEHLTDTMTEMERDLIEHEEHITRITAEKERMGAELDLARQIQEGALPNAVPDRPEFSLSATMTPARQVGGDFYDYFMIDGDHLGLVIADVSGKGIPAALFMMVSKALIRNQLLSGCDPAAALERANLQLSEGNASFTFVTVWLAVVELSTGKGLACNAGHENPALRRAGEGFNLLQYKHDTVMGVMKNAKYRTHEFELCHGDCLFVYTDGVPEANNAAKEMFGEKRLLETLNENPGAEPEELIRKVREAVDCFAGGAPQFDDITMLCFEYKRGL